MIEERILLSEDGAFFTQSEVEKLDLLNRDDFVGQVMDLIDIVTSGKGSCTLAINGKWGSGKTFVLEKLEHKLKQEQNEESASDRFLVFHYNCWQYDYYDEPLIAIVSAMIDGIKSAKNLLPEKVIRIFKTILNTLGGLIWDIVKEGGKKQIKEKTKFDTDSIIKRFQTEKSAISESECAKAFDDYETFNMVMTEVRRQFAQIAEEISVVYIVDELDRCLPSYAIKVMERLHHLFYGVKNTVTVMAVDKDQLGNTVKQIYGDCTNTDEYLRKFIDYEITLDTGTINDKFAQKYEPYISMFEADVLSENFSIEDYFAALFDGIDIRTQEHLMERLQTVHRILYSKPIKDEKKDYSFMCFELLLIYLKHKKITQNPIQLDYENFKYETISNVFSEKFNQYIATTWGILQLSHHTDTIYSKKSGYNYSNSRKTQTFVSNSNIIDIPFLLTWFLYEFFDDGEDYKYNSKAIIYLNKSIPNYDKLFGYIAEFKKIYNLLEIIK